MIALALSCSPTVLLADEPTTALDVTVQIQILLLLRELQRELGMAVIFVTHDVGAAVEVSDRLAVMYAGRFVETGAVRDVLRKRAHPYTEGLLAANLHGVEPGSRLMTIAGAPRTSRRCRLGAAARAAPMPCRCSETMPPVIAATAMSRAAGAPRAIKGGLEDTPVFLASILPEITPANPEIAMVGHVCFTAALGSVCSSRSRA